ncbi:MAG: hypothetical protein U1A78_38595 [Polyangia bacterium]
MSPRLSNFPSGSVTFDLTDPAERFVVEAIQFFHSERPRRYRVLAMRRVDVTDAGKRLRLVLQAVRIQPPRRGARPVWQVLVWDIDGPGVTFLTRPSRAAMLALFRSLYSDGAAAPLVTDRDASRQV